MDIDDPHEPIGQVSPFSVAFPLPFRVLSLIGMGGMCWATNMHLLEALGLDPSYVLQVRNDRYTLPSSLYGRPYFPHNLASLSYVHALHPPIYRLLLVYFAWIAAGWFSFTYFTGGVATDLDAYKLIPTITWLGVIAAATMPLSPPLHLQRSLLYRSLIRCAFSPRTQPVHFADVITADILTSFAKVLGDIWLSVIILAPGGSLLNAPKPSGISEIAIPLLMSFPYIIRFRQCIMDYLGSNRRSQRPLYNAVKYATAFPVILLSAGQRLETVEDDIFPDGSWHPLFRLWVLAVLINSGYSFWWDVTNDWGLEFLKPGTWNTLAQKQQHSYSVLPQSSDEVIYMEPRTPSAISSPQTHAHVRKNSTSLTSPSLATFKPPGPAPSSSLSSSYSSEGSVPSPPRGTYTKYPFGLRRQLLFRPCLVYYLAILLNFVLRFTWSLKLSSHLHGVAELESGVFLIEGAELLRRWMWVFLRVEWEAIRQEEGTEAADREGPLLWPAAAVGNEGIEESAELSQIAPGS